MTPDQPDLIERIIHNGQILDPVPGVKTEQLPLFAETPPTHREVPQTVQDIDPNQLAGIMALTISEALEETPVPPPMEIVNRLLRLKTTRGHKALWTRFDVNQLFALWTNKLERGRAVR